MKPEIERQVDDLAKALESFGAGPGQSLVMARQLLKRAEQIAAREGIAEAAALARLLEVVRAGRAGEEWKG